MCMINKNYYIAVDFDGTLVDNNFPNVGNPRWNIIEQLQRRVDTLSESGYNVIIILWTCRHEDTLNIAKNWCENNLPSNLIPKYYNENLDFETGSRKIVADEYWDDRAIAVL